MGDGSGRVIKSGKKNLCQPLLGHNSLQEDRGAILFVSPLGMEKTEHF